MIEKKIEKRNTCFRNVNKKLIENEQFYTKEAIITKCIIKSKEYINNISSCLDFSAGNNKFNNIMKEHFDEIHNFYAFDVEPTNANVLKKDFFDVEPFHVDLIGFNPPFGWKSSIAKKFLEHAAKFSPKYFLVILPFNLSYIYPNQYEEIYVESLSPDVFYSPKSSKTTNVKNCKFCILKRNTTFIYQKPKKEIPISFPNIHKFAKGKKSQWNPNFTCGFAVRCHGANAGKQVLVYINQEIIMINQHGNEIRMNALSDISSLNFHVYQTDFVPDIKFIRDLWNELKTIYEIIGRGVMPSLNTPDTNRCIASVLQKK